MTDVKKTGCKLAALICLFLALMSLVLAVIACENTAGNDNPDITGQGNDISRVTGLWLPEHYIDENFWVTDPPNFHRTVPVFQFNSDLSVYEYSLWWIFGNLLLTGNSENNTIGHTEISLENIISNYLHNKLYFFDHDEFLNNSRINTFNESSVNTFIFGEIAFVLEDGMIILGNGVKLHRFIYSSEPLPSEILTRTIGNNRSNFPALGRIFLEDKTVIIGMPDAVSPHADVEVSVQHNSATRLIGRGTAAEDGSFRVVLHELTYSEVLMSDGIIYVAQKEEGKDWSNWTRLAILIGVYFY
ncbi:MAG: hypothetical protein FWG89_06090 [Treponema sp.]|nr:hypothetical protein [Treponema sp.]